MIFRNRKDAGRKLAAEPSRFKSASTAASSKPSAGITATTCGLPSVSVPVLTTNSVSIFSKRSSASVFLIRTSFRTAGRTMNVASVPLC
jgi:hypothetical protein